MADSSTGLGFPQYEASTEIWKNGQQLYEHGHQMLKDTFANEDFLLIIIVNSERHPDELGGFEALFNKLKIVIEVSFANLFLKYINIANCS